MDSIAAALDRQGTLYHVTYAARLERILEHGLLPLDVAGMAPRPDSRNEHVYLSDRDCAEDYLAEHEGEQLVVLAVDCRELKPWNLAADEQNFGYHPGQAGAYDLEPPRQGESADRWAARVGLDDEDKVIRSLEMGSVAYKGTVSPRALSVVELAPPSLSRLEEPTVPSGPEATPSHGLAI